MRNTPPPSSSASKAVSPLVPLEEIAAVIQQMDPVPPVILNAEEAANISRYTVGTLKKLAGEDRFPLSTIKGKPVRFWRDKFVFEVVNHQPARKVRKAKPCWESADTSRISKTGGRK